MGRGIRSLTPIVLIAMAALLAACGGSKEENTTPSTDAASATAAPAPVEAPTEKREKTGSATAKRTMDGKHGAQDASSKSPSSGKNSVKTGGHQRNESPARKADRRCPDSMTRNQCRQAAGAVKAGKAAGSHPSAANRCPSTEKKNCEEAGAAYEQAESTSHPADTRECPAAMTEQQCREAGEAYAEATR